jgi:hypothetical protein
MKASELIKVLQDVISEHGDVDVIIDAAGEELTVFPWCGDDGITLDIRDGKLFI